MNKEVIQKAKAQIKNKWFETKKDELDMSLNIIDDLLLENKKYKEVIDKALKFIDNYMYENYCYVGSEDKLKDILKEVE